MKIYDDTIVADEGMILTDGTVYGKIIRIAEDRTPDEFTEITEEVYDKIQKELEEKEINELEQKG